ncbi:MAG: ABC transporter permease [Spartobacteria bacterium]|nr:ABC transporter permease [Spartobacteria bacterium]
MGTVWSIARLSIQAAVRSRLALMLVVMLGLLIFFLPLNLEADGTLEGYVRIVLVYTLGIARFLLSIMAVWLGCLAISGDIQDRRIQLVITKPVSSTQLWLGKWLGITLLVGGLLVCAGTVTFVSLHRAAVRLLTEAGESPDGREALFVARRRVTPRPTDYNTEARALLDERLAQGLLPEGLNRNEAIAGIAESIRMEYSTLANNEYAQWIFDVPPSRIREKEPLLLQYTFTAPEIDPEPLACVWLIGTSRDPARYRADTHSTPGGVYTIELPPELLSTEEAILVQCVNAADKPVSMVFPRRDSVVLLQYAGHFAGNYARGMAMLFLHMAFLAAVGVTAGACFSTPVAAFASLWLVIMIGLGGVIEELSRTANFFNTSHIGAPPAPGFIDQALQVYFRGLYFIFGPFRSINTLEMLATNQLIEWGTLLRYSVYWLPLGCGVLALAGIWMLNHREMAWQG